MTSVAGLQLDSLASTERITELFPKCRPGPGRPQSQSRDRDVARDSLSLALSTRLPAPANELMDGNKDRLDCDEEADDASASAVDTSDDESNDSDCPGRAASLPSPAQAPSQAQQQGNSQSPSQAQSPLGQASHENLGKGGTYKLRDSRIIEIAGGREVFCQSRSKPGRKGRQVRENRDREEANTTKTNKTETPERRVWELRSRCGEAKRQRNSRDLSDMFSSDSRGRLRSGLSSRKLSSNAAYEPIPTSAPSLSMGGGEVVVFDDIGENWRGNGSSSAASTPSPPGHHRAPSHYFKVSTSVSDAENDSLSPDRGDGPDDSDDLPNSRNVLSTALGGSHLVGNRSAASRKGSRIIGGLPIADYEGSPRRYGPRQGESGGSHPTLPSAHSLLSSPSLLAPRPGFPQRVLPDCNVSPPTSTASTTNSTFDYLYEFSETRKVLEEFFKPSTDLPNNEDNTHFQEQPENEQENNLMELSTGSGSTEDLGDTEVGLQVGHSRNFTLSPETTDCDSNCGDLDSEVSLMLTDGDTPGLATGLTGGVGSGLSSGLGDIGSGLPVDAMRLYSSMPVLEDGLSSGHASDTDNNNPTVMLMKRQISEIERELRQQSSRSKLDDRNELSEALDHLTGPHVNSSSLTVTSITNSVTGRDRERDSSYPDPELEALDPLAQWCAASSSQSTPPPPAPAPHRSQAGGTPDNVSQSIPCRSSVSSVNSGEGVEEVIKDIRLAIQRAKTLPVKSVESEPPQPTASPIWVPRRRNCDNDLRRTTLSGDEHADDDEADTDLETDRLLGQLRTDDIGYYEPQTEKDLGKKKGRNKEDGRWDPAVLIEGVLFRARYLGSTQLVCEGQPTKTTRMMQAEEAVSRIKAPDGETQPSTEVDLFISTEKIMVLNTDLKEIMMDHALRTISYIADIGDLVVLMARRRFMPQDDDSDSKLSRTPKMICHVFQSEEAQFIAQSIGQAFQVAYMEFLKANGIEDNSFVKEMDYQEVLNSQEIFGDELQMFAKKEMQKEVVVPKAKGEILGVVIVESGWGSMLPTVVIANLAPAGAAARCGQLNIGDQIIAINGVSLVGLPLSTCQNYIKNTKTQTVVKLTVVPCAPVVEVKIKRPETKYQLGFSVQNGVICSLLRGGIAERGGVRVGHRIIEINNQSVVAVPHEKIVNLLATSVGEILMKTMPTSMFRLLTGQETPIYI